MYRGDFPFFHAYKPVSLHVETYYLAPILLFELTLVVSIRIRKVVLILLKGSQAWNRLELVGEIVKKGSQTFDR